MRNRLNVSAERSLKLKPSHSPNSAKRFLRKRFRSFDRSRSIIKLKLKKKYCIKFLLCNLLTGVESAVWRSRIRPYFLSLNSYYNY
ncbi:hypothetical protein LEP1GSC021_3815 [Leptospira noguchii str. 1993005606]|nr:hypothetical protein LEP1GSC021_3815 [Leptospira noguchii str. 1993005606]